MAFYRQWALGCVGACALAFAGCQEDNEAALKAQGNLPPPADAKGEASQPPPRTQEEWAKRQQEQQKGGGGYPTNYPGMSKAKTAPAKTAPASADAESK